MEDAGMIHRIEQLQPPGIRMPEPQELRTPPQSPLVFQYDDAKNQATWKRLEPDPPPPIYRSKVKVVGQFETIAPQVPGPMGSGFGHLDAFAHALILVDVVSTRALESDK